MLRLALLILSGALLAAEPAKPRELTITSTSRTGLSNQLIATVPAVFTTTIKDLPGNKPEALQAISAESADQRVQILITLMPPNEEWPRDAAWLEATFRKVFADFVSGSVEGKMTPFPIKLTNGIGVAAVFSDKDEAGKPTAKGRGHYKLVTNALVRVGDSSLATVSIFSDSKEAPDYLAALKVVAGLRAGK